MSGRMLKVNELIRQELSRLIHEKLGGLIGLVTVTDVETTSDLQLATIHVSVLDSDAGKVRKQLQKHAHYFHRSLGKLRMKFIPKLTFVINDEDRHQSIEQLYKEIE